MPAFEAEAIRPHVAGRFADLLRAAIDASGDARLSRPVALRRARLGASGRRAGRGLNENLAREVLELHTLGVGAATARTTCGEFAELLTGLVVDRAPGATAFRRRRAEPGPETVLGRRYGGGRGVGGRHRRGARATSRRIPATARHIARKLAVHFVADEPDPDLVAAARARPSSTPGAT